MDESSKKRQPGFQDWRFLMVLFASCSLLEIVAWGHLMAFTPLYLAKELDVPETDVPRWTGLLFSSSLVLALPLAPFWGIIADRYSRKLVIARSLYIETVVFGLVAMAGDVRYFLLARILLGLSFGNYAIVLATQSLVTPEKLIGTAIGTVQMVFPLGMSLGPLIGSFLIGLIGMRGMFAFDAFLTFLSGTLIMFLLKDPPSRNTTSLRQQVSQTFSYLLHSPLIRWNFIAGFLIMGAFAMIEPYMPILIGQLHRGSNLATIIGIILAAYGITNSLSTPLVGRVGDRLGHSQVLSAALLVLSLLVMALSGVSSIGGLVVLALLRAVPQAGTNSLLYAVLALQIPAQWRAAVMSVAPLPRNLAMFLAPLIASQLSTQGLPVLFRTSAFTYLLAFVASLFLLREVGRSRRKQ